MTRHHSLLIPLLTCVLLPLAHIRAQDDLPALEEQAIKAAVAKVAPSVLRIDTIGGLEQVGGMLVGGGSTTGLAVSPDGYVVSSAFNFVQQPSSILVTLPSGKRAAAQIVAHDRSRMLVVLKVQTDEPLVVPQAVPREEMAVGQWTIAVGRTYEGELPNLSVGVMSALSRMWGKAIQTDAKISPNNYGGPLIDIRGRVLGVLVPLSPQQQDEMAGAEWYDSGIGFAIPLADILSQLDKLKSGQDLHPGLLGITLKGADVYADPAEIAACQPKSPARQVGLKPGDRIIEAEGKPIQCQAQLKHVLGPRYAGDKVKLVAMRGEQRVEFSVELVDKLVPYEHPFIGLLPNRSPATQPGIVVRYVYPGSPAAEAGLQAEDRLTRLADKPVPDLKTAIEILGNYEPGQTIGLAIERQGQAKELQVKLASLPAALPEAKLPPPRRPAPDAAGARPPVGKIEIKIPEEKNNCIAYVPENYHPDVTYGVVLWLHEPGGQDGQKLAEKWKALCDANDLILLAPQSADPQRWSPTEIDFVRKTLDDVISKYHVDPARITACGEQAGGAMAYLTAFAHRTLIRGVATADAPLPVRLQVAPNDPVERLAILTTVGKESKLAERIRAVVKQLREAKYPVVFQEHDGDARPFTDQELADLVRWVDTLDRI